MRRVILDVDDVSKRYATYKSVGRRALSWFDIETVPENEFRALSNVSFKLHAGETVAIIGQNGAGKSTLLKLITGTVRPTSGRIAVGGRINALLELGIGFNPEFTGRQNVFMSGGMMGLSNAEIEVILPDVIDFAEIGHFFEQPLRVYSSGMQARLAFAIATAIKPDILIVDEVLSVGDSYFQHKSFDRIRRFKEQGVAILFVTHGMGDVRSLCDRVILLDKGTLLRDGPPDEVVDYYNALVAEKENARATIEQRRQKDGWNVTRSGNFKAVARDLQLIDAATAESVTVARVGQKLCLRLVADFTDDVPTVILGCLLKDRLGNAIWGTNTLYTEQVLSEIKVGEHVVFTLDFPCDLGPGSYSWTTALASSASQLNNYEWTDNALVFDVVNVDCEYFVGSTRLPGVFTIERNGTSPNAEKKIEGKPSTARAPPAANVAGNPGQTSPHDHISLREDER